MLDNSVLGSSIDSTICLLALLINDFSIIIWRIHYQDMPKGYSINLNPILRDSYHIVCLILSFIGRDKNTKIIIKGKRVFMRKEGTIEIVSKALKTEISVF